MPGVYASKPQGVVKSFTTTDDVFIPESKKTTCLLQRIHASNATRLFFPISRNKKIK